MFQISTAQRNDRCVLYSNSGIFFRAHSSFEEYKPVKFRPRVKQGQSVYRPSLCRKLQDNADPDLQFSEFISLLYRHFVGPLG